MGGEISLDSEPGEGSTFRVDLPLPEAGAFNASVKGASFDLSAGPEATTRPLRILLVEDDATVAEVIVQLLALQVEHEDFFGRFLNLQQPHPCTCFIKQVYRTVGLLSIRQVLTR